ncbi:MAG: zinc-dependent alcohol dehydrogenase family protein [Halioglobus sp.]|nr:zinc-dependent alcohol dehydrogenase family protein [Halioglobus sp.]
MRAMSLSRIGSLEENPEPLQLVDLPVPQPGPDEVLIRVAACGVCHTELDEIEGRTPPPHLPIVPGHEVIGRVERCGEDVTRLQVGERVGVGWIFDSTGAPDENLSEHFRATGRDVNGGYAEYMCVPENYAYPIPDVFGDAEAAPLLCAGGVGYRALRLTGIGAGQRLGLTGFGGSAHIVLQIVRHRFEDTQVYVFARSPAEREFALELGAAWAGDTDDAPPQLLDAIIDTTPAWKPVLAAMTALKPGGRLVINAIRKEAGDRALMADISYEDHLWLEKEIKTVANVTARDIAEFLQVAAQIPLRAETTTFELEQANTALQQLKAGHIRGAYVLLTGAAD